MPEEKKENRVKIKIEEDSEITSPEAEAKPQVEPEVSTPEDKPQKEKPEVTQEPKSESGADEPKTTEDGDLKENKPESDKIPNWIIVLAFFGGLALGAGLIGGIFYYRSSVDNMLPEETPTTFEQLAPEETSEPSDLSSPESSPSANANFDKYSLQILNGSGISGEAGRVDALLTKAGFGDTTTGNADSYDYEATEVAVKASLPEAVYEAISSALSTYELAKADSLPSTSPYDVVITVGKSKK